MPGWWLTVVPVALASVVWRLVAGLWPGCRGCAESGRIVRQLDWKCSSLVLLLHVVSALGAGRSLVLPAARLQAHGVRTG